MNIQKVNQLIDSLEICAKGKNTVRQILEEVSGKPLSPLPQTTYSRGDRLTSSYYEPSGQYVLVSYQNKEVAAISLTNPGMTATGWHGVGNDRKITQVELDKILPSAHKAD